MLKKISYVGTRWLAIICVCTGVSGVASTLAAPVAQANVTGDYCKAQPIGPGGECIHPVAHNFIETEGWTKGGTSNCNGVTNGSSWIGWVCNGSGAPPDEAYCTTACAGLGGEAFIHDHSAFSSDVYTGWLDASS